MVFGLCPAHEEKELLRLPHLKDISTSALSTATDTRVSMRKQKLK